MESTALRAARRAAGLTQRELAEATGVAQANISAYEHGRRPISDELAARLLRAARPRPSELIARHADRIRELCAMNNATDPRIFGSAARGTDRRDSDIDLLVRLAPEASLFDLAGLKGDLEDLLGINVDVVDDAALTDGSFSRAVIADARPV